MKLYAHVGADGEIEGLIAMPSGKLTIMLTPNPGIQVCEIQDHGLKGDSVTPDQLEKLLKGNKVAVTPAKGKLVRRKE